ncbi:ATP-binding protein [Halopenitus sp. H-Gu1]|uniref:ATP-binding protein n=1 Tax=Halopenitus sp. H-Gu1 TaxID=3242697 RepID=UPI00359D1E8B
MVPLPEMRQLNSSVTIASIGILFFGFYLAYVVVNDAYRQGPVWLFPIGILLVGVLAGGLVYGGYWVATSEFTPDEGWQVTIWLFAGLIAALALTFWPIFYQRIVGVSIEDPIFILLVSSGLGANAGAVAGISEVRSERQFQRVEQSRDSLEFLNRLLRHNVLNAVAIIRGNADLLFERTQSETTADHARTVREQSDQIAKLIKNVKVLVHRIGDDPEIEPIELTPIVQQELETARKTHDNVCIKTDLTPEVVVQADPLVGAVIENIVTNAIVHNDQEHPEVQITLDTKDGSAKLAIADNGPGLPDETRESLVNPGLHGDRGLGLHLVDTLVTQYGGEISFAERTPRGTVVTIDLPVAKAE